MPQVANLEREVEWVLGELEEEREAGARHIKDAAARVREAEQAAARVKSMRKDDTKRLAKEKAALAERVMVSPPWQCHADCACPAEQLAACALAVQQHCPSTASLSQVLVLWQELEAAALKRDGQAENMQSSAASALAQHDAAVAALQERLSAAETGSAKLRSEVSSS